jgi:hypothetical protein
VADPVVFHTAAVRSRHHAGYDKHIEGEGAHDEVLGIAGVMGDLVALNRSDPDARPAAMITKQHNGRRHGPLYVVSHVRIYVVDIDLDGNCLAMSYRPLEPFRDLDDGHDTAGIELGPCLLGRHRPDRERIMGRSQVVYELS